MQMDAVRSNPTLQNGVPMKQSWNWMMGKFTGKPIKFDGKNHGFRLRFSLKPIQ